jgi:quercetin dioxygenase-like cupin family protein
VNVVRIGDAQTYVAPKHFDMRSLRLAGFEAGGPESFWVGLSHFLPAGGAEMDSGPTEKVYVVISGEVTVTVASGAFTLGPLDTCAIAPGEARSIENRTNLPATMLVVVKAAA